MKINRIINRPRNKYDVVGKQRITSAIVGVFLLFMVYGSMPLANLTQAEAATPTCTNSNTSSISSSGYVSTYSPAYVLDNKLSTNWVNKETGSWIKIDLADGKIVCNLDIAWQKGNNRQYDFVVSVSKDNIAYTNVYSGKSSGTTYKAEKYEFADTLAKYVKVTVNGNTLNTYAVISEMDIFGYVPDSIPPSITAPADIVVPAVGILTDVTIGQPIVADNIDASLTVTNNAPTDGFSVGTTLVTWTATDDAGNSASDVQKVTLSVPNPAIRPTLVSLFREDSPNKVELISLINKYNTASDYVFPSKSVQYLDQLSGIVGQKMAPAAELSGLDNLPLIKEKASWVIYNLEYWGTGSEQKKYEYEHYMETVKTASKIAHDNGYKFAFTPVYKDIQTYDTQFAPYCDMVVLQIPHFIKDYATTVKKHTDNIKAANPNAVVLVQLMPRDQNNNQMNTDPSEIIDAYNSVKYAVDGVLVFYFNDPDPVPILDQFYFEVGLKPVT